MDLPNAPTRNRRRRWPWIALAALLVAALSVVGYTLYTNYANSRPLADDPAGAKACSTLADWLNGKLKDRDTGKAEKQIYVEATIGDYAASSTTAGIRATAGDDIMTGDTGELLKSYGGPRSLRFAKIEATRYACKAAGVDMPAWNPPAN